MGRIEVNLKLVFFFSELQRTNLDVNMAVNNLLTRDDEEGDDDGDGGGQGGSGEASYRDSFLWVTCLSLSQLPPPLSLLFPSTPLQLLVFTALFNSLFHPSPGINGHIDPLNSGPSMFFPITHSVSPLYNPTFR